MELWNEYEGRTVAGTFLLQRLIRPEGRSAFFTTTNEIGQDTVIRLIEAHYDEEEILARWRAITQLGQNHLLNLHRFGHVVMDDTSLIYAVMEPADADLGQVLGERVLTVDETRQLAVSLAAALETLHTAGLIHEHIQPVNILAVGETIKLRSDCIREAPEGPEGDALRARDLHDFALVLLQALTLDRDPDRVLHPAPNSSSLLPSPFREIIYNGASGRWTLAQIANALDNSAPSSFPEAVPVTTATGASRPAPAARPNPTPIAIETVPATLPSRLASNDTSNGNSATGAAIPQPHASAPISSASRVIVKPGRFDDHANAERSNRWPVVRAALASVALLVLVMILWRVTHRPSSPNPPAQPAVSIEQPAVPSVAPKPSAEISQRPIPLPHPVGHPAAAAPVSSANASNFHWRVIAFTYNEASQAQSKADRLAQRNPGLHFDVFSPHGHAPYLVTIGGFMSREEAFALRDKLRGRDFPRDIYAQNYGGR